MAVKPDDTRLAPRRPNLTVVEGGERPQPREDARLVEALKAERPAAFNELVGSYQNAVFSLAYRLVRDREEARDVTQDVFLKAYRRIPQMEGELHLWAWLYRVTVNTCWDHLRAASRRPVPSEEAGDLAGVVAGDEGERRELARLFSDSLSCLSPRQQAALVLKDVHGLTHADIADTLGISRASSEILLFRARHSFRRAYSELVAEEHEAHVCRYAERAAAAAVGGRLSPAQRRRILEHARSCEPCSQVVASWRRDTRGGLALVLPLVAAPPLFGGHGGLTAAAGLAGAKTGAAAGGGAAGGAASSAATVSGAAATAPLLGAGASSGVVVGGLAAKVAGLGAVKAAAVVLAATSVAVYGGVQAGKVVPAAPPPSESQVAAVAATPSPSPSPSTDLAAGSAVVAQQSAAEAAAAEKQAQERLQRQLRLLRRAAALTGDARLVAQVRDLNLMLTASESLAGADALRQWNNVTRRAMRMLRAIGGRGPGEQGHTDTLVALVRGAQARVRLAAETTPPPGASGAGPAHTVAVARPAASAAAGGSAASRSGSSTSSSNEPAPSNVDPSGELGGIRDATPDKGGDPVGDLPRKPVKPGGLQGGTLAP